MPRARYLTTLRAVLPALISLIGVACSDDPPAGPKPPVLTTVEVSLLPTDIEVGQQIVATATGLDQNDNPIAIGSVTWTSQHPEIAGINPTTGAILAIAPGATDITATVDGKSGTLTLTVVTAPAIRINEVQPRGELNTGWIEFFNPTTSPVDMSAWTLVDNNFFGPTFTFPEQSVIQPGGRLVIEEADLPFGFDASDVAHLFSRFGVSVDGAAWDVQAPTTRSRCPDGTGTFIDTPTPTKAAANACS